MIESLVIRDFTIARKVEINFEDSLTTVTGETGAGKSIIVDALAILLGDRADNDLIRHDCDQAEIEGHFTFPVDHPAQTWLQQQDLADDSQCILRRVIRGDKPSRGWINGRAVAAMQLKQLGSLLVDIHGQHEHHSLMQKSSQRDILDSLAGSLSDLIELAPVHEKILKTRQVLHDLLVDAEMIQEKIDLLSYQLQELEALNPIPDEWPELEKQHRRLGHQRELVDTARLIVNRLYEDEHDSVTTRIGQVEHQLSQLSHIDPDLQSIAKILQEANVNIEEATIRLREDYCDLEFDAQQAEDIELRFSLYHDLSRKHRIEPENLAACRQALKADLARLQNPDEEKIILQNQLDELEKQYEKIACIISNKRQTCAVKLGGQVSEAMQDLGMKGGTFKVELQQLSATASKRFGNESVIFLVSTNPGHPMQPLSKIASGGELSRLSLAIQVITAGANQVSTLVFDEIDVGIGGAVADTVGKQLQQLGMTRQIICITHLSQVAARGKHQITVTKTQGKKTDVMVKQLDDQQRIEEIARMTAGARLTEKAIAHAEELLREG